MTTVRRARRGTILPILGICLIGIFGFVALAVDLGILAVSRTQCQNAADVGALVGARSLNNKPGVSDSNRTQAIQDARDAITGTGGTTKPGNYHLSSVFNAGQISNVQAGMYTYFPGSPPTVPAEFRADFLTAPGAGQSWTAMKVEISTTQPTYFMRVFGVNTMPMGAYAVAVHRPRDIAFSLDMTGSMAFSSLFNFGSQSLNPDTMAPRFGHYVSVQNRLIATANQTQGSGEVAQRNNYTIGTPGGPPIVRNFFFSTANSANPATLATTVPTTTNAGVIVADLKNAFHRWSPPESLADAENYVGPTYDFAGYNAMHNGSEFTPMGPTPAPDTFKSMTDSGAILYVGDRYRRADGSINKTDATWATGAATTKAATTAVELLGYNVSGTNVRKDATATNVGQNPITDQFRDPVWETYGYDLDIPKYRAWKTTYNSGNPALAAAYVAHANGGAGNVNNILVPAADRLVGYSMGPGYWGKTFFVWPPDPRPAFDWRLKFFYRTGTTAFDPQGDNNGGTAGTPGVSQQLLNGSANGQVLTGSANYAINYPAVLAWLKTGPQVLPPNLRAGHVLYYTSIPDAVTGAAAATELGRDQQFWKNYIDFVLGANYTGGGNLYGVGDSWASAATSIFAATLNPWAGPVAATPWTGGDLKKPYMRYNDSPNRPRLHFWFGPLSMMDFLGAVQNWLPGTCYESQCWQLKAGMNAVIDDIRNNHPNDNVAMTMFATDYTTPRVVVGQKYTALKNALYYPRTLLTALDVPTPTVASVQTEYRPYNDSFGDKGAANIPNARGGTDPNTGLMIAYNMLSPSASTSTATYGTVKGRRGASKIVIMETDGVPNTYRTRTFNTAGYNSYYTIPGGSTYTFNGDPVVLNQTYPVVQQIVKNMQPGVTGDSGLSLPNAAALVYPIAFGDLFDTVLAPGAGATRTAATNFLNQVAVDGGTGSLTTDQIITGTYANRIATLRTCMERIFQSGVSVTLIE